MYAANSVLSSSAARMFLICILWMKKKEWVNVYAMLSDTSEGQINIAWEKVPKTFPIELTVQPIVECTPSR